MARPKLAVLDGGFYQRGVFAGESPTFLLPTRGAAIRPDRFDIVIVPFYVDQIFLTERRQELELFVDNGGVLLVLGACDVASSGWIPFCQWTSDFTNKTSIVTGSPAAEKVFSHVANVRFHTHWHAHGALVPLRPKNTEVLAMGEQNRPVMLLVRTAKGGAAVITTLDPDHHSAPMIPGGSKRTTEPARQNALLLLHNLLTLSKDLASSQLSTSVWKVPEARKVFLSHKSSNSQFVREYKSALLEIGYTTWLDDDILAAGTELERGILKGMQESCGAVFFITPEFEDDKWLSKEIDYAIEEKNTRKDGFAIVTIVFSNKTGKKGVVPDLLTRFVYKEPKSDLEALREIVRALPLRPGPMVWR